MVSKIFNYHPYLGKWSKLTNIFEMGWNHQLVAHWGFNEPSIMRFGSWHPILRFINPSLRSERNQVFSCGCIGDASYSLISGLYNKPLKGVVLSKEDCMAQAGVCVVEVDSLSVFSMFNSQDFQNTLTQWVIYMTGSQGMIYVLHATLHIKK